ncbi:MAG: glycosyltransferase family 39 protein [Bacteroidia bacterium]
MKGLASQNPSVQSLWVALGVLSLNVCLKVLHLGSQYIALDEPFTLFWSQQSVSDIWELAKNENNPPLHFLIEHFWIKLFGIGPVSVRFPSLIFSSLTAAIMFLVTNRRFGWVSGVGASLIFTLSTEQIYHSHEARTYSLLGLLTVLSIGSLLRVLEEPKRVQGYVFLGIWNVLLAYSHFLGMWMLIAEGLVILVSSQRRLLIPRMVLMYLGVGLAYAPNLIAFLLRLQSVAAKPTWVPKPHWTQIYGHVNIYWNGAWATLAFIGISALGLAWAIFRRKQTPDSPWKSPQGFIWVVLAIVFSTIYFGIYLQSLFFTPAFIPRYLVWVSVPFFLVIAGWIALLFQDRRLQIGAFAAIALAMLPGFTLNPSNDRAVGPMVSYAEQARSANSILVIAPDYFDKTYLYHADLEAFQDPAHWDANKKSRGIYAVNGFNALPPQVLDSAAQVVFVDADAKFVYPENGILDGLKQRFKLQQSQHFEKGMDVFVLGK